MAIIKVLAGDLRKGKQRIDPKWVKNAEVQTEEKLKKLSGSAGWGFLGAFLGGVLTGGVGFAVGGLAGILSGGNKTEICFSCELEDGRKFLAITDNKTWQKILGVLFEKNQVNINSSNEDKNQPILPVTNDKKEEFTTSNKLIDTVSSSQEHSQKDNNSGIKSYGKLILSRFWKWYISGFASRPDLPLWRSPRLYRIILSLYIFGLLGNMIPDSSISSNNTTSISSTASVSSSQQTKPSSSTSSNSSQELTDNDLCNSIINEVVNKSSTLRGREAEEYFTKVSRVMTTNVNGSDMIDTCSKSVPSSKLQEFKNALVVLRNNF
ncbi:MAG: hypothetical protein QNJ42_12270 [Crocosphaera sp.]|nr:hypothetical protein [Crocosphaera sp.]